MATPRELSRQRTVARIIDIGFTQLDAGGPSELNLRAAARELGIVSSAIYRYVADRDAYLTLLISSAYGQLAEAVDKQVASAPTLRGIAHAMRSWALEHPQRWGLIYGTPVVGYEAPKDTVAPGTKVMRMLLDALSDASPVPGATLPELPPLDRRTGGELEAIRSEWAPGLDAASIERAVEAWSRLVGLISAEVFGYFGADTFTDPSALFTRSVGRIAADLGLAD